MPRPSSGRFDSDVFADIRMPVDSGRSALRSSFLYRPQDLDAAQHNAFVDLVRVEWHADGSEQHDGQPAAEMLAELVESFEQGGLIAVPHRELGRIHGQSQCSEEIDD